MRSKNNLKLDSLLIQNKLRTRRVAVATNITLGNMRLLRELKESEKGHKDHVVSPVINAKNCPKTMESLEKYLRGHIGVKGVPIYYVVISEEAMAPSLD